jgi:hypothetical protein
MADGAEVMNDVFLSYAREDKPVAERVVAALTRGGFTIWWDGLHSRFYDARSATRRSEEVRGIGRAGASRSG